MPRQDWMRGDEERRDWDDRDRRPDRAEPARDAPPEDYGQADYDMDYAYDPERRHGYRRSGDDPGEEDRPGWRERASAFFGRGPATEREPRRRPGPSDRVLWTVIVERLEDARGLDLRDVEVLVEDAEVTLNGTVRRREDKRRIEDIADVDGVRNVQNNLRARERRWFS